MSLPENLTGSAEAAGLRHVGFLISPFADRVLRHIMGVAKKSHPAVRAILVAGHVRRLARELRLVLDRDPEIPKKSGKTVFALGGR